MKALLVFIAWCGLFVLYWPVALLQSIQAWLAGPRAINDSFAAAKRVWQVSR